MQRAKTICRRDLPAGLTLARARLSHAKQMRCSDEEDQLKTTRHALGLFLVLSAASCGDHTDGSNSESGTTRPAGWTEATHGDVVADYSTVFPDAAVARIDIEIAPADWRTMIDDMTVLAGEFGTGTGAPGSAGQPGGVDGGVPPEGFDGGVPPEGVDGGAPPDGIDGGLPPGAGGAGSFPQRPGAGGAGNQRPIGAGGVNDAFAGGDMNQLISGTPVWVPCTVHADGLVWQYVGIRFKGNSTLATPWQQGVWKLPFRLDLDHFDDAHPEVRGQRFYGFEKLSFGNNAHDASLLRDKMAADFLRDAGVPAPRTAFYRVYIDHGDGSQYFGLYAMAEIPDQPMLTAQFGAPGGNLYKPEGGRWDTFEVAYFEKQNHEAEADYSDVEQAVQALSADRSDAVTWREGFEARFDADGFLRWLATNTLIENWDTYGVMTHNYYLYGDPTAGGVLRWISWDHNEALTDSARAPSLQLEEVGTNWPLIRFLLDDPTYQARYFQYLADALDGAFEVATAQARLRASHDLIAPFVAGADGEQPGYTFLAGAESFEAELDVLLAHVATRNQLGAAALGR